MHNVQKRSDALQKSYSECRMIFKMCLFILERSFMMEVPTT